MDQKFIDKMTGYKATDANVTCLGHRFELGKWHEIEGEIELCKRGFHFCVFPSGPWAYYSDTGTRIFKVEAEQVLECPPEPGAEFKLVAKRIRLIEEITPGLKGGDSNTGHRNTGHWNTGDWNTGNGNTGNWNTGNWNTGDSNTGDRNTGHRNTGNGNTGYWNTGYWNTGDWNTGYWNACNNSSGFFCAKEPKVISFDVQTRLTRQQFEEKYPEICALGELLGGEAEIPFEQFKRIPGITKEKLKALHKAHVEGRKKVKP
jgi:hypothetical protein